MTFRWIGAALVVGLVSAAGCSTGDDTATTVEPETRGQRGESCQARNDCASGLACISATCSKNDFDVTVSAMHCDQIDCSADEDCCNGKPLEAPAKCDNRTLICETPSLPDCLGGACAAADDCGSGACSAVGTCSSTFTTCTADTDCAETCLGGFCSINTGFTCLVATDCPYSAATCQRSCDCTNTLYAPGDPICTDPDCFDICNLRCREERCVPDSSCEVSTDCFPLGFTICEEGLCVECLEDADCNEDIGETCIANRCDKPCAQNEECPLFHQCMDGDCVETGCLSDRDCVLAAGGPTAVEDGRLSKCLPSDEDPSINTCKVPCENDGACGSQFQVCDAGYCRFVGCENDEQCRAYLGLASVDPELMGFAPKAVCRP